MKRGTPDHPKVLDLQQRLGIGRALAVGLLELLWHWTARYAPAGDVGRWSDAALASGCGWDGDPASLVSALVGARLLDEDGQARLVVHDWPEHADDAVHSALYRAVRCFVDGTEPRASRLSRKERGELDKRWESARQAHAVRTESALPEPRPAPPEPRQSPAAAAAAEGAPPGPPAAASLTDADIVRELGELSEELARLQVELTGKPVTATEVLLVASRTERGKAFASPSGGRPAWRAATLDRLRARALELRDSAAATRDWRRRRAELEAATRDPPEERRRAENTWGLVLACLERLVGRQAFATWCRPTRGLQLRGQDLLVLVPNGDFVAWFEGWGPKVCQAINEAGLTCRVRYLAELQEAG